MCMRPNSTANSLANQCITTANEPILISAHSPMREWLVRLSKLVPVDVEPSTHTYTCWTHRYKHCLQHCIRLVRFMFEFVMNRITYSTWFRAIALNGHWSELKPKIRLFILPWIMTWSSPYRKLLFYSKADCSFHFAQTESNAYISRSITFPFPHWIES